MKSKIVLFH